MSLQFVGKFYWFNASKCFNIMKQEVILKCNYCINITLYNDILSVVKL